MAAAAVRGGRVIPATATPARHGTPARRGSARAWQTLSAPPEAEEKQLRHVEPQVHLIARPRLDYDEVAAYLADVGGGSWLERVDRGDLDDAQNLAEFAGRIWRKV
jgi:hypothetical protein